MHKMLCGLTNSQNQNYKEYLWKETTYLIHPKEKSGGRVRETRLGKKERSIRDKVGEFNFS